MGDRIHEVGLEGADIRLYEQVMVAGPGEHETGIVVWAARDIAGFYSADTPARTDVRRQLVVEVADPEDAATRDRITAKCMELRQAASGKG